MRESLRNLILQSGTIVALAWEFFDRSRKVKKVIIATWNQPLTLADIQEIAEAAWPNSSLKDVCVASDDNASLVLASKL